MSALETKKKLMDSAERQFARRGFYGASIRAITDGAGVPLAAANYHFGSKAGLYKAVFERRFRSVNYQRLAMLDAFEKMNLDGQAHPEQVVRAWLEPLVRLCADSESGGRAFAQVLAKQLNYVDAHALEVFDEIIDPISRRFLSALQASLPDMSAENVTWGFFFGFGALGHVIAYTGRVEKLSQGMCDSTDVDGIIEHIVPFIIGGLESMAHNTRTPLPTLRAVRS